ncbi:LLM class F420-dependent oxidoreductase [Thermostaphylospora chromogena]|uniref:F420-dependent oxidoreductase, MSMEG_4879 family n=1 Tax=Thermostaphylospora chromogena TaxID=35622 RepID=A0A1H1HHQ7_9ACTN|nr:LLM class F420-dependent oxidoreductase [Thermostaphylospora chromogena]SDR24668.1 F420-dependent oxidoreductase, MSMEG_4879 family [Thermostaphylospora chromogena]
MRIGLLVNAPSARPDAMDVLHASIARAARDGFPSVWMSQIFGLDALTALTAAGIRVPGVELGTAVVPVQPRHPVALAQQALTADLALGGRLALGVGLSHKVVIEHVFGYDFDRPAAYMEEYLSILVPLLRGQRVDRAGERVSARVGLEVHRPNEVPVLVAALGPRMLRLAGTVADGTVLWMTGPKTVAEHIVPTIVEAAKAAGRPEPRVVCMLPVCVTDDAAAARARADELFAGYGELPSYRAMLDREGASGPGDVAIVGDEDAVRAQIQTLSEAGATDFVAADFSPEGDERTREFLKTLL